MLPKTNNTFPPCTQVDVLNWNGARAPLPVEEGGAIKLPPAPDPDMPLGKYHVIFSDYTGLTHLSRIYSKCVFPLVWGFDWFRNKGSARIRSRATSDILKIQVQDLDQSSGTKI